MGKNIQVEKLRKIEGILDENEEISFHFYMDDKNQY